MTNYKPLHWIIVKQIFHYLKGTMDHRLSSSRSLNLPIVGYCNANYTRGIDTQRSTIQYTFLLSGSAISWNYKKQPTIALLIIEVKYIATTNVFKEVI